MRFGVVVTALGIFGLTACSAIIGVNDIFLSGGPGGDVDGGGITEGGSSETGSPDSGPISCNADLQTDLKNCGACGHDCTNGKCVEGLCVLGEQLPGISHLVVRGSQVFVGLQGNDGDIASCPTTGCASASVGLKILSERDAGVSMEPFRIAANDQHVFVSEYLGSGGSVDRVNVGGGGFKRLPGAPAITARVYGVALDATTLYFTTNDSTAKVYSCPLPDCATATQVAPTANGEIIVVSPSGVIVWGENSGGLLMRCPSKTGCTPAPLVPDFDGVANDIVVEGETVYWITNLGEIHSCSTAGCANTTKIVADPAKTNAGVSMAVSGSSLYWATIPFDTDGNNVIAEEGEIHGCTLPACTDQRTIAKHQNDPASMGVDAKSVYWGNSGHRGFIDVRDNVPNGTVVRVLLPAALDGAALGDTDARSESGAPACIVP